MFRYAPRENRNSKLICPVCDFEIKDIPVHCGSPMKWKLTRSFRKGQVLSCRVCKHVIPMPYHCGVPMIYSEADYRDVPELTDLDLESMNEAYSATFQNEKKDNNVAS